MKTFNVLKWTGYTVLGVPAILIIAAIYASVFKDDSDKSLFIKSSDRSVVYDTIKIYDTVHIKVYDTVKIQEKPKQNISQQSQANTDNKDTIE